MSDKFVIADPGTCIGCKTCMAACLSKHDTPGDVAVARLNLVTTLSVSAPIVCHHCADAPCIAACPVSALYEDEAAGRVGIREDRCIGCQSCVMACPYGAVTVTTRNVSARLGNLSISAYEKPVVIKCDLCADRVGGPACVQACPTKGLVLVDQEMLDESVKKRNREAAAASATYSSVPLNPTLA